MRRVWRANAAVMLLVTLAAGSKGGARLSPGERSRVDSRSSTVEQKANGGTMHATGTFEVKVAPLPFEDAEADSKLGRMSLDKQFHGDLEGTSKGQMLTAGTDVKGSAAYVAIERVAGTLDGRKGTFIFQHSGTMTGGVPHLSVTVVPDSGTGQLAGLSGTMTIKIDGGKHSYDFEYTIPESH